LVGSLPFAQFGTYALPFSFDLIPISTTLVQNFAPNSRHANFGGQIAVEFVIMKEGSSLRDAKNDPKIPAAESHRVRASCQGVHGRRQGDSGAWLKCARRALSQVGRRLARGSTGLSR
jgi:hypothetical protein